MSEVIFGKGLLLQQGHAEAPDHGTWLQLSLLEAAGLATGSNLLPVTN